MLPILRKNTKVIIWSVIVCFALWGGFSVGTQFQKKGRYAGEVFGKNITFQEYDSFYKAAQIFVADGTQPDDPDKIRVQAWQNIILYYAAKKEGVKVSNDETRNELLRLLKTQGLESFDANAYRVWLERSLRTTPQAFEKQVHHLLLIRKLIAKVRDGYHFEISAEDALNRFLLDKNQLEAEILLFETKEAAETFLADKKLSPANWEAESVEFKKDPKFFITTGKISLFAWKQYWRFDDKTLFDLLNASSDNIQGPFAFQKKHGLVLIKNKIMASESDFTESTKAEYLEAIKNFETQKHFMSWYLDIFRQANFKDYLPTSAAAEEDKPPFPEQK